MSASRARLAALLFAVTLVSSSAHAQPASDAEAARAFADAEAAFTANDYEAALSGFRKAHTLRRHDATQR